MLSQKRLVSDIGTLASKGPAHVGKTVDHKSNALETPFPFYRLPGELRNKIYHLCLVDARPISIESREPLGFDNQPRSESHLDDGEDNDALTTGKQTHVNTSLVRIDSTIHDEAAPILYGHNTFVFEGCCSWNDFSYFKSLLTRTSLKHIRNIEIIFPYLPRFYWSSRSFMPFCRRGLKNLKKLPALQTLTLHLYEDVTPDYYSSLRTIRRGFSGNCQIAINVHEARFLDGHQGVHKRRVRISSKMLRKMHAWGWFTAGSWEVVDKHHPLQMQSLWTLFLYQEWLCSAVGAR